ncbi:MAG TPA: hypothetical protein VKZ84_06880 [Bacteriovoracaceae bacterium]|nr:hypothetical protein [Bacteriovoracaceae bacterium]
MRDLYIGGGQRKAKKGGVMWKLYLFLFLFIITVGGALKISAPVIVERWLNQRGSDNSGFTYSVREVELSLKEGEMILKDLKVFHPKSNEELLKTSSLKLRMNLQEIFNTSASRVEVSADQLNVFLSNELISEINRMKDIKENENIYFALIQGKFSQVNVIEKKIDESRTLARLVDVNLEMKELSLTSINKSTEFNLTSTLSTGGEMKLSGKVSQEEEENSWNIEGSLKEFSPELLNRLAGTQLPFSFNESALNANIVARSDKGKVTGEIVPDITRLNLIIERRGYEPQVIARALTDELTFSLPFTIKEDLTLEYEDTFKKLKDYRKYPSVASLGRN